MSKETKEKSSVAGKIVKIVLLAVVACIIIFVAHTMRNFFIIKNIVGLQKNLTYINNVTRISTVNNNSFTVVAYKKKNLEKTIVGNNTKGTVVWITYKDTSTGEEIRVCEGADTKFYTKNIDQYKNTMVNLAVGFNGYEQNARTMLAGGIHCIIVSERVNEKDCYKVIIDQNQTYWVEKDTGLVIKAKGGESEVDYTYNFSIVDDSVFKLPDLSKYEQREN